MVFLVAVFTIIALIKAWARGRNAPFEITFLMIFLDVLIMLEILYTRLTKNINTKYKIK